MRIRELNLDFFHIHGLEVTLSLVHRRYSDRISADAPAVLAQVFLGLPHSFQANAGKVFD
jgi:hypothetical protein